MRNNAATERIMASLRGSMANSTVPSLSPRLLSLLQDEGLSSTLGPTLTSGWQRKTLDAPQKTRSLLFGNNYNDPPPQQVSLVEKESIVHEKPDVTIPLFKRQPCLPEEFPGVSFPSKLLIMLNKAEAEGYSDIVSFLPNGKSFMIHKPKAFAQEIMPRFFKTSRFTSFQKQLSLYGFKRARHGLDVGAIRHQHFRRDDQKLVAKIQRPKPRRARPVGSEETSA